MVSLALAEETAGLSILWMVGFSIIFFLLALYVDQVPSLPPAPYIPPSLPPSSSSISSNSTTTTFLLTRPSFLFRPLAP